MTQISKIKAHLRSASITLGAVLLPGVAIAQNVPSQRGTQIDLLEDVGGGNTLTINTSDVAGTFIDYFNIITQVLFTSAVGFCILWFLIGGIQMILSGGDQGKVGEGKSRIIWSLVGLLSLALAGAVLRFLNSAFFT